MNALDDDRLLTFEEAAEYLNVSESTLRRMIANREISASGSEVDPEVSFASAHRHSRRRHGDAKQIAPAFPFAPDEIVEALETWAGSGNVLVKQGTRLRASHELVHRWPEKWIRDGASDDEKVQARHHLRPEPEPAQHEPLAKPAPVLLDEECCPWYPAYSTAQRMATHTWAGRLRYRREHVYAARQDRQGEPAHFVNIVSAGRTRENRVRALTDWGRVPKGRGRELHT